MTAISAPQSAREGANPFRPTVSAHIRIPGSARTYEVRDVLRGMGLRWDPVSRAWHESLPAEKGALLGKQLGLKPQVVPTIEAFSPEPPSELVAAPPRPPTRPPTPPRHHDFSRTRAEARLVYPEEHDEVEEFATPTRRFTIHEITSGPPDDPRDADEKEEERRVRDVRARVKVAHAILATTPGFSETLEADWRRAALFYARFGITEGMFRWGVSSHQEA
jgi:hypothetical protein